MKSWAVWLDEALVDGLAWAVHLEYVCLFWVLFCCHGEIRELDLMPSEIIVSVRMSLGAGESLEHMAEEAMSGYA